MVATIISPAYLLSPDPALLLGCSPAIHQGKLN